MKTIHKYFLKSWALNFSFSFLILSSLLLVGNLVKEGVPFFLIAPVIPAIIPSMFIYTLPLSSLIATIGTLAKARTHNELTALAASGIGLQKILSLQMGIGVLLCAITIFSMEWIQPAAESFKREYLGKLGTQLLQSELQKEQSVLRSESLDVYTFKSGETRSAVIQEKKEQRITKEYYSKDIGIHVNHEKNSVSLLLKDVFVLVYSTSADVVRLQGSDFSSELNYGNFHPKVFSYRQMRLSKMRQLLDENSGVADRPKLLATYHEKLSLAISPLILIFAAFPLSFIGGIHSRLMSFFMGLLCVFVFYYPMMIYGKRMVCSGSEPAWFFLQLPNILLFVISLIFIQRSNRKV